MVHVAACVCADPQHPGGLDWSARVGMSQLAAFHFLHPLWLLALPPLLALAIWFKWRQRREGAWSNVVDSQLLDALRLTDGRRGQSPWPLIGIVWTLAV